MDCIHENPESPSLQGMQFYMAHLSTYLSTYKSLINYLAAARKYIRKHDGVDETQASPSWPDLMRGYKRILGNSHNSKLPMTPGLLIKTRQIICNDTGSNINFRLAAWAAILTGFYYFLRKSNITVTPFTKNMFQIITKSDISIATSHIWIKTHWSKTNNFRDRSSLHATKVMPGSPLCLAKALSDTFKANDISPTDHAFAYKSNHKLLYMRDSTLQTYFKHVLSKAGVDPTSYSLHSLRSGGATFAFQFGPPSEAIKHRGDWKSLAYLRYIEFGKEAKAQVADRIAQALSSIQY